MTPGARWAGADELSGGHSREQKLLGSKASKQSSGTVVGAGNLGAGGDVELGLVCAAEPDVMPEADLHVGWQVDRQWVVNAAGGRALPAGGRDSHRSCGLCVGAGRGEGRQCVLEGGDGDASDVGQPVQGGWACGRLVVVSPEIVIAGDLAMEPRRQHGQQGIEGDVISCGHAGEVGRERFPGGRGDADG